jgi:hypothetical protein
MGTRREGRPGRLVSVAMTAIAFAVVLAWTVPAWAAETTGSISLGGTVFAEKCTPCHATIADSNSSEIIFKHAYHLLIACSSCHTAFPHRPEGTAIPKMKECFNCHGLRHGPQGLLATGECLKCHRTPRAKLRPAFHVFNWAEKPHVDPSRKELRTRCMMCHDQKQCDECHIKKSIVWKPDEPFTYDAGKGCDSCHGQATLTKVSNGQPKSFEVPAMASDSAHGKLACQDCHPDFKYYDAVDQTKLWEVNAGLGCRACHTGNVAKYASQTATWAKNVAVYDTSIHASKLLGGNLQSATCSSCHGGHDIKLLNTPEARAALRASAFTVCARCHLDKYNSYDDYYHGKAYKSGAADAPSCWDCHGSHFIQPSADASSPTHPGANLARTCGKCHEGSETSFASSAGYLIHKKTEVSESNPLARVIAKVRSWFS